MKKNILSRLLVTSGIVGSIAFALAHMTHAQAAKPDMEPREIRMGVIGPRIVGGQEAEANQARWITSLQYDGEHFCGGALVRPDWVLTAAHCVVGESASNPEFSVWVGGYNLKQPDQGVRVDVTEIITHENYSDSTLQNDIALLRLASPVSSDIQPVNIATSAIMSGAAAPNQPVTISGWGVLAEGGNIPDVLHEVQVPVVSNAICNAPESYSGEISTDQICAGLRAGGKDSCQGDSGGPLWLSSGNKYYHVGIVSYGDGCARPDKYGVYTRTLSYNSWLEARFNGEAQPEGTNQGGNTDNAGDDSNDDNNPGETNGDELFDTCSAFFSEEESMGDNTQNTAVQLEGFDQKFDLEGDINDMLLFSVNVADSALTLDVSISDGEGDADLYVAHNRIPTVNDYDLAPFVDGNDETVSVESPAAGVWYIMIHGYDQFEGLSLNVSSF